jgi:hypothetical protein
MGEDGTETTPSRTIDAYVAARGLHPRLVKVDVEGAEPFVLTGMAETLHHHRPVVVLEVHGDWLPNGVSIDDVEATMRDAGYAGETYSDGESGIRRQIWMPIDDPDRVSSR